MSSEIAALAKIGIDAANFARGSRPSAVDVKALHDFVTDTDRRLQEQIIGALEQAFPGVSAFGEEGMTEDARLPSEAFVVDPLDGTSNYIFGLPFCAVSLALISNGRSVLGVVVDIFGGRIFAAERGLGATINDVKLTVPNPDAGLIAISTGLMDSIKNTSSYSALRQYGKLRNLGSQALQLCAVAQGALVMNASMEARLWDDAAGRLIAEEAGARYSSGVSLTEALRPCTPQKSIAAHPALYDSVASIIRPIFDGNEK